MEKHTADTTDAKLYERDVVLSVASLPEDLAEYFRVRAEVFVEEQGLFTGSDEDEHDAGGVHIIAKAHGCVVGVVRCYRHKGNVWYGGRLAVRKEYRTGVNIGAMLVRKAVEVMIARGNVRRFLAAVQLQNVRFFQRIGWARLGRPFMMRGRKHQIMENKLARGSNDCHRQAS
ncbi:MAG: GNAT family N-acetyltransferase [Desulfovibrio sp.]|jgi:putative N-acetyltransferase (TIGR04045 family)|nr:GNAT family N-acetyltransferase [Desulfovibrio sp.]